MCASGDQDRSFGLALTVESRPAADTNGVAGCGLIIARITESETLAVLRILRPATVVSKSVAGVEWILSMTTSSVKPKPSISITSSLVIFLSGYCPKQVAAATAQRRSRITSFRLGI